MQDLRRLELLESCRGCLASFQHTCLRKERLNVTGFRSRSVEWREVQTGAVRSRRDTPANGPTPPCQSSAWGQSPFGLTEPWIDYEHRNVSARMRGLHAQKVAPGWQIRNSK